MLFASWMSKTKIAGCGSEFGSRSISQRHGSADPDPHQNVMDPEAEHWYCCNWLYLHMVYKGTASLRIRNRNQMRVRSDPPFCRIRIGIPGPSFPDLGQIQPFWNNMHNYCKFRRIRIRACRPDQTFLTWKYVLSLQIWSGPIRCWLFVCGIFWEKLENSS